MGGEERGVKEKERKNVVLHCVCSQQNAEVTCELWYIRDGNVLLWSHTQKKWLCAHECDA